MKLEPTILISRRPCITKKVRFLRAFAAWLGWRDPVPGNAIPAVDCLPVGAARPLASRWLGSRCSKAWSGHSIYPSYLRILGASGRTARLDRVGELDAGHPETFDHDPRHAQAQSFLLRITDETGQGHHVSFHRHQLISRQHVAPKPITRPVCPYYPLNRPPHSGQ